MKLSSSLRIQDPLYGEVELCPEIHGLVRQALVQRLRQIRLSNIDSMSMPGIANISRYEHSVGVAYLAAQIGFQHRIPLTDRLILQAAGLIHDTAITPFGHLVEESLHYLGWNYEHEEKWSLLFESREAKELGGIDLQMYLGYESGLRSWADDTFGIHAKEVLKEILNAVKGKGRYGNCIAGEMDLDNLDNITRVAFHMGLSVDPKLPLRIAQSIEGSEEGTGAIFSDRSVNLITQWLQLREDVYNRLMLSREDFCGKVMLIYSSVLALEREFISPSEWVLTDSAFIQRLLDCPDNEINKTVKRWLLGDVWALSDLFWLEGKAAGFDQIYAFTKVISEALGRQCFAYGIKDKRTRKLSLSFASGERFDFGEAPSKWLLGIASPVGRGFSNDENRHITSVATEFFSTQFLGYSDVPESHVTLF